MDLGSASLITPGTVVSNTLVPGNRTDLYQFTSAAGDRLFFDRTFLGSGLSVYWRLIDPYSNEVFGGSFNDVNTITQRVAGTYTLLIVPMVVLIGGGGGAALDRLAVAALVLLILAQAARALPIRAKMRRFASSALR